jgi:hypothetical protein
MMAEEGLGAEHVAKKMVGVFIIYLLLACIS